MSTQATTWAFSQTDGLTIAQKFVLVALANSADKSGVTWVGQDSVATDCACTRETVSRNMTALEEAGFIRRVRRTRVNGSRTSDYTVLAPLHQDRGAMTDASSEEFPEDVVAVARQCDDRSRGQCDDHALVNVTQTGGPEPSVEPSVSSPSGEDTAREPVAFTDWLQHHARVAGHSVPGVGTQRRGHLLRAFRAIEADGFNPDDFIAASRAVTTEWHKERGHDSFETVLRKTEFGAKVARGRKLLGQDGADQAARDKYDGLDGTPPAEGDLF